LHSGTITEFSPADPLTTVAPLVNKHIQNSMSAVGLYSDNAATAEGFSARSISTTSLTNNI